MDTKDKLYYKSLQWTTSYFTYRHETCLNHIIVAGTQYKESFMMIYGFKSYIFTSRCYLIHFSPSDESFWCLNNYMYSCKNDSSSSCVWQLGCRVAIILLERSCAADAVPLLPVHWCSFHQPWKDDRLSQPHLVLVQQPTGLKLRTPRSQTSHPSHKANTRL